MTIMSRKDVFASSFRKLEALRDYYTNCVECGRQLFPDGTCPTGCWWTSI